MTTAGQIEKQADAYSLTGDWTLAYYGSLRAQVSAILSTHGRDIIPDLDLSGIGQIDTAGAALLAELLGTERLSRLASDSDGLSAERQALLQVVAGAMSRSGEVPVDSYPPLIRPFGLIGQQVESFLKNARLLLGFIGQTLLIFLSSMVRPKRWRITPLVAHTHQVGLNALPIVALLTFLVGAVVAFLGATVLRDFGATIYTVNLVAFSFLREFGVLLAAILLAGRTASAFTAQLGSMKANEEIDAIRAQGLDPIELLVVPRMLAMMISLPILTFVGMISGILGGALVCVVSLDISVPQILIILERDVAINHFLVGLGKAPVFAFAIAVIGCLEGFKVSGSAQSVGEHTTSSVVQSIFLVILLDAIAALFFMEMGW